MRSTIFLIKNYYLWLSSLRNESRLYSHVLVARLALSSPCQWARRQLFSACFASIRAARITDKLDQLSQVCHRRHANKLDFFLLHQTTGGQTKDGVGLRRYQSHLSQRDLAQFNLVYEP